jgi:hypothetical protein
MSADDLKNDDDKDPRESEIERLRQELDDLREQVRRERYESTYSAKNYSARIAFIIDSDHLEWLDRVLSKVDQKRQYEIVTRGSESQIFDSIDKVIALPNSKKYAIKQIRGFVPGLYRDKVSIDVRSDNSDYTAKYYVGGDTESETNLSKDIDDWLDEIRPWYHHIATINFIWLLLGIFIAIFAVMFVGAIFYVTFSLLSRDLSEPFPESPRTVGLALLTILLNWGWLFLIIIGAIVNLIRKPLFPLTTFALGQGIKRKRQLDWIRNLVFITITLAIIIRLAVSWMFHA